MRSFGGGVPALEPEQSPRGRFGDSLSAPQWAEGGTVQYADCFRKSGDSL